SRPVVIASQTLPTGLPPGTVLPAGTPLPGPLEVTAGEVVEVPSGNLPVNVIRGAYKAAENNSPRPTDRVVFNYNYYANVNTFLLPPGVSPTAVHRYTAAVEKTFLGGDASVELRLPFLQITGDPSIEKDSFGDLS